MSSENEKTEHSEDASVVQERKSSLPIRRISPIAEADEGQGCPRESTLSHPSSDPEEIYTLSLPNLSDLLLPMESSGRPPQDEDGQERSGASSPHSDSTLEDAEREDSPYDRLMPPLAEKLRNKYSNHGNNNMVNKSLLNEASPDVYQSPPAHTSHQSLQASHMSPLSQASHMSPLSQASHMSPLSQASHMSPLSQASHISPLSQASHMSPLSQASYQSPVVHTYQSSTFSQKMQPSHSYHSAQSQQLAPLAHHSQQSPLAHHSQQSPLAHHSQQSPLAHKTQQSPLAHVPQMKAFNFSTHQSLEPQWSNQHPLSTGVGNVDDPGNPPPPSTAHSTLPLEGTVAQRVAQFSQGQFPNQPSQAESVAAPHTNWRAKFHEVDLSQTSQIFDEDYHSNHQRYHLHTYQGSDCSPSTKHSWEDTTAVVPQHPPSNTHGNSQEQNGYLSDEGLSITSSMEELTLINKEAQNWNGSTHVNIVKPLPINKDLTKSAEHLQAQHHHHHSASQPSDMTWGEGRQGSHSGYTRPDMSLSQPWGGGVYDHYGYTLSQPVSHQGLTSGYLPSTIRQHRTRSNRHVDTKALHDAAASGDHLLLRRLLSGSHPHLTPTVRDESNSTPLHKAAQNGHLHCLRFLLRSAQSDAVHLWDDDCNTPTLLAIQNGHLECVRWLVEEGGVPMVVPDSGGETLLHYSAFHGQAKILEWLLDRIRQTDDADVDDVMDESGITPAHFAAYYGHLECLQLLWGQGVNLIIKDKYNHTPVDWARSARQTLCSNYLTTVETCLNLMEENSELQQQVFDLQVSNQQLMEDIHASNVAHQKEVERLHQDFETRLESYKQAMPHSGFRHARRLRSHDSSKVSNKMYPQQKVERHSLEDIEGQKERAKEDLKMRKMKLRKKLQENSEQKGPEDVLAVMRAMSPLSPMLKREQKPTATTKPMPTQATPTPGTRRDSRDNGKSVTFADQVAKAAQRQKHNHSAVEVDIDAAINKKDQHVTSRGYKEINIDKAMDDNTLSLEVNIDEAIRKRGPKTHKGIMKRHLM